MKIKYYILLVFGTFGLVMPGVAATVSRIDVSGAKRMDAESV